MTPKTLATTALTVAACFAPLAASAATSAVSGDVTVAAPRAESVNEVLAGLESRMTVNTPWSDEFKNSVL